MDGKQRQGRWVGLRGVVVGVANYEGRLCCAFTHQMASEV
jgi:hypothetical protein